MKAPRIHRHIMVLLAALGAAACSSATAGSQDPPSQGMDNAEIEALYRARVDSARMRFFTEADTRFMSGMIHHHAQAIEMSQMAPSRTTSSSIRTLAARIINAQNDEIALMQRWLRHRQQPVPEVHVSEAGVMVHGAGHDTHHRMPGMLTPEQLDELRAASGSEFDRLYLTFMIEHHKGAVTMVRELFATDGAGQDEEAFRLASDVQVDQITEVRRMESMLAAMGGRAQPR